MIRLELLGPHTKILSTMCSACPHSPGGCCVAPPRVDLSDIGRIVSLGGRDWLLEEIARGRLVPVERWLTIRRTKRVIGERGPRLAACVYLGPSGCTIPHDRRSATCNYYVCESALSAEDAGAEAARARRIHDDLVRDYTAWEDAIAARLRARWPDGPPFDAAFLDWVGAMYDELTRTTG